MTTHELFVECYSSCHMATEEILDKMVDENGKMLEPLDPEKVAELLRLTSLAKGAAKELRQRIP